MRFAFLEALQLAQHFSFTEFWGQLSAKYTGVAVRFCKYKEKGYAFVSDRLYAALSRAVGKRVQRLLKFAALCILICLSVLPYYIKLPLNEMLTPFPALENANSPSKQRLFAWL